jgi:hypothetical protein
MHRFGIIYVDEIEDELFMTSDFIQELNRGELTVPNLASVFFVHSTYHVVNIVDSGKKHCCSYCSKLTAATEAPKQWSQSL